MTPNDTLICLWKQAVEAPYKQIPFVPETLRNETGSGFGAPVRYAQQGLETAGQYLGMVGKVQPKVSELYAQAGNGMARTLGSPVTAVQQGYDYLKNYWDKAQPAIKAATPAASAVGGAAKLMGVNTNDPKQVQNFSLPLQAAGWWGANKEKMMPWLIGGGGLLAAWMLMSMMRGQQEPQNPQNKREVVYLK